MTIQWVFDVIIPMVAGIACNAFILAMVALSIYQQVTNRHTRYAHTSNRGYRYWKHLDRIDTLSVVPATNREASHVSGTYRGHQVYIAISYDMGDNSPVQPCQVVMFPQSVEPNQETLASFAEINKPLSHLTLHSLLLPNYTPQKFSKTISIDQAGRVIYDKSVLDVSEIELDILADIADSYPTIVALGGIAVPALVELRRLGLPNSTLAESLLLRINAETKARIAPHMKELLCPMCLAYPTLKAVDPGHFKSAAKYYGCSQCGQSHYLSADRPIARLDTHMTDLYQIHNDQITVNWLQHNRPFGFAQVEIIDATDKAVEQLVLQVASEADADQRKGYKLVPVIIDPTCNLSENSRRLLANQFGNVRIQRVTRSI